tara:strand:- start:819 stop:1061 length:243 start_codon:yes stop_codon:yes gene_type:complete
MPYRIELTAVDIQTLGALAALITEKPYPPSLGELAERLEVTITPAHKRLERLRDLGWVEWEPGKGRTIRLVKKPNSPREE